jgi:hypothetical protein
MLLLTSDLDPTMMN